MMSAPVWDDTRMDDPERSRVTTVPVVRFTVTGADPVSQARVVGTPGRPYTVIYDGSCKVCGKLVNVLAEWDTQGLLEITPSQAPGVHARFPWIPLRAYMESVQVVRTADGKTWQGAAAIEAVINVMPKGQLIGWVFAIPFMRPLAERFYRWFARNRYHLGCGEHCQYKPLDVTYEP
jgi:predicted DCC family thiol-disulfide oxidoreductase YuxK